MQGINHDLRSVNSGTIFLVPDPDYVNLAIPDISVPDTIKKYDIGTKFEFNGKAYFYAYAGGTVGGNMGANIKNPQDVAQVVFTAITGVIAGAVGATQLTFTPVTADGPTYNGIFPLDYLKGGTAVIFNNTGVTYDFSRGIIRSTARPADTGTLTITLDAPIQHQLTTSGKIEIMASPWANVVAGANTHESANLCAVAGIPACRATVGTWLWLQTWGPCWAVSPKTDVGAAASEHAVYFLGDGSTGGGEQSDGIAHSLSSTGQHAGWVMSFAHGGGQAAPIMYLQIAR